MVAGDKRLQCGTAKQGGQGVGRFLNRDNQKYAKFSTTKYFVDKTGMINKLLEKDDNEKFLCCSRPRRFGKSITTHMLVAYFSRGRNRAACLRR